MTLPTPKIASLTTAVAVTATLLGCGVISQVRQAADTLSTVGDLAQHLEQAKNLTYTADYRLPDGTTATVVQQPPNAAYLGPGGRFILTPESLLMCQGSPGAADATCQKSANTAPGELDAGTAGMLPTIAGGGFVSAQMALALLTVASVTPGAKVDKSTRTVAGQSSTCLKVTNLPADSDPNTPDVGEFSACVADSGLLTAFSGRRSDGDQIGVEMVKYRAAADPAAFATPAGYRVVDVDHLQPAG